MLKVIIADDEARVCRLVQALADWEALGMEVAGTAANGLEALELLEQLRPDILITDIRMPGCHGLELIQRAKQRLPHLEIVIISGYAHFEYAQSAIKHGVGDYLLKPIQREELMATLQKLGERCRARQSAASTQEQLRRYSQEDRRRRQERLIQDLAQGRLSAPTPEQLEREYQVTLGPGPLQAALLKLDFDPDQFSEASVQLIREKAEKSFRAALEPLCHALVLCFGGAWGCAVLNYPPQQREVVRHRLRDCLNQLVAQSALLGPVEFSLSLGSPVQGAQQLPDCFREAALAMDERLLEGSGRVLEGVPPGSGLGEEKLLERYGRAVELVLDTLDVQEADEAARQLEESAMQVAHVRGRELSQLVRAAGRLFALRLNAQDSRRTLEAFEGRCSQCSRAESLFACLRRFQQEQLEQFAQRRQNEAQRPIRVAKQYIQRHYSENITLEDVCEATGFSVSYFSALFKKETGEGFAKYLTRVRLDKAKELLQETNLPVAEICTQVGYGDLKHFNQTFKKTTSLSPGQYRKLYG